MVELHANLLYFFNKKHKFISKKDKLEPWINHDLKNMIKRRENLLGLRDLGKISYISTISYNRYRNFVTISLRNEKKKLFLQCNYEREK